MRPWLFLLVGVVSVLCSGTALAQAGAPLYELRGIWLTTLGALDWPSPQNTTPAQQEAELRALIRNAKARGLNAVLFQAVSRADALYPSDRLPWAPWPTGVVGLDPGFDPLGVAIEEAHANGMELHVWFNVYRSTSVTTTGEGPRHVSETHPEWLERGGEWLNPGRPGVNEWLIANVMEIVTRYDLDAIHFDFIRYDQGGYGANDRALFDANPNGFTGLDDWRRGNVNQFVRDVYAAVTTAKPWVKVGSTPVGHYDGSCLTRALKGFSDVFQDSRRWLEEGMHDYIVPQLYWPITHAPGRSSFACLVDDWTTKSSRHVVAGIGAYLHAVQAQLPQEIDLSRASGARGQVYFRDAFVRNQAYGGRYTTRALPPPVAWRAEAAAPFPPAAAAVTFDPATSSATLTWAPSLAGSDGDPLRGYAVFRRAGGEPGLTRGEDLLAFVPRTETSFIDSLDSSSAPSVGYRVVAVSRLGVLSGPSPAVFLNRSTTPASPDPSY